MKSKIIIGSRGSKLALIYAQIAKDKIIQNTNLKNEDVTIKGIVTKGDKIQDKRLSEIGGKGLFSSNISASTGAEDFSYFAQEVPGLYFWLGVNDVGVDSAPGNHTPYFVVHDSALDKGVRAFVNLVSDYSKDQSPN